MLTPARKVPNLDLPLTNGTRFELEKQSPEAFTMLVFYRGKHCPICKDYLEEVGGRLEDFVERGVNVFAVSMDEHDRAMVVDSEWDTHNLPLAYEMNEETARSWGLYISSGREGSDEPERFSEPGLFLIRPDMTLFFAQKQSAPFTRPPLGQLLDGIDLIKEKNYPARGDLT